MDDNKAAVSIILKLHFDLEFLSYKTLPTVVQLRCTAKFRLSYLISFY